MISLSYNNLTYYFQPSTAKQFEGSFYYEIYKQRFVGFLTLALNYRLHDLNVTGYHVLNFLVHVINALLVYCLVLLTFKTPFLSRLKIKDHAGEIAFFTSVVFACHPLQTQAVTYIWQRVTSIAVMFYLFSLVSYIKWKLVNDPDSYSPKLNTSKQHKARSAQTVKAGGIKRNVFYVISILSAVLSMKTKEISFTLPIMIAAYELVFFKGNLKRRLLYLVPVLLTILIIPLTLVEIDKPLGELISDISQSTREQTDMSRMDYLFTQSTVIMTYIRLVFLPINQNLDYDYPVISSVNTEVFLSSLVILMTITIAAFLFYRFRNDEPLTRLIFFCVLWFFITLSVESSFIPIVDVIFEHRMYLPSIGIFLLVVAMMFVVMERLNDRFKYIKKLIFGMLALIVFLLAGTTYARNNVWKDEISLWQDVVQKSPQKERAHRNLGLAYRSKGLTDKAIDQYSGSSAESVGKKVDK